MTSKTSSRARLFALAGAAAALAFPGTAGAAVTSTVNGLGELTVTSTAGDGIAITCAADRLQINGADAGSGPAACSAITEINVTGGPGANAISLTGVTAAAFPEAEPILLSGDGGNDAIAGSELVDQMRGGEGNDRIAGDDNPANSGDLFNGEAGDDTLVWNPGDDDDVMEGGPGADTIEVNGGGGPEQFTVKPSLAAGRVQFDRTGPTPPGPFNIDIGTAERLDMNAGGGDDTFTADAGLDALGLALDIDGGAGNDSLDGGDGADLITGGPDNDRIVPDDNPANTRDDARGDAGDDTIVWNGGDDDDLNEGGDGNDTIEVNGAAAGEQFTVKPSPAAGRVLFDRTGPTPPGPFNIDIGTAERLDLNANGGNDTVTADSGFAGLALDVEGGEGDDILDGGDAPDLLSGGIGNDRLIGDDNPATTRDQSRGDAGDDTMVWNGGDDDDINEGGDGNDTVEVNGATADERFTVKPSPVVGRVAFDRTSQNPGLFNIDIGTSELLLLNAGAGNDTIDTRKGLAGLIAGVFNGAEGNDKIEGTGSPDKLSGGTGRDLIRARDNAADEVDCDGGFDFARVDRRDRVRACEIVFGGSLKVKHLGKTLDVSGGAAALKLRCVATERCSGRAVLLSGGKTLGSTRFKLGRGKVKTFRIKLNGRGRRLLAGAGSKLTLRIDARDSAFNGWRTTAKVRLAR